MIIFKRKDFTGILNTRGASGFINGRKYDQDLNRLGRMETSGRELHRIGDLRKETRKMNSLLNKGKREWLDID